MILSANFVSYVYLLRLWRETGDGPWRISLQEGVHSERLGFADLESLASYLDYLMGRREAGPMEQSAPDMSFTEKGE